MKPAAPEFVAPLTPVNVPVRRCRIPQKAASRRILIMRLASYGDVLMGTPLLAALRDAWPDAHITWIVERDFQDAIRANPHVDEVLLWEGGYWKKMLRRCLYPLWLARALAFGHLLHGRYNVFISFQPEEWPLLTRAVGAGKSIGIFDTFRRFNRDRPTSQRTRLYSDAFADPDLPPHRTDQYLLALRALGLPPAADKQMVMGFTEEDATAASQWLGDGGPAIVLVPLATWPSRCWPKDRWVALADVLAQEYQARIVLIGSAKERPALDEISSQMRTAALVAGGTLTFRQIAALLARASLVVTGDTGPMHVAAAVGTPTVALFGPTAISNLAPLAGRVRALARPVPCGPCDQKDCPNTGNDFMRCLHLLTVEDVLTAARERLEAGLNAV